MSKPSPGNSDIDKKWKEVSDEMFKFSAKDAKNLSFDLLGEIGERAMKMAATAFRYQNIANAKKLGGHIGGTKTPGPKAK